MSLHAHGLSFSYTATPVLSGVGLSAQRGEVCALLGPNGAGKTTLLRLLLGLLRPTAGSVSLEDLPLEKLTPKQRALRMAYVPQQVMSRFPMTVFEAVLLGRKPHMTWGPSRDDFARTGRVLAELGLEELAGRRVSELSGGQRQRVALARALVQDTPWLLLDEPTSSLDLRHQVDVLEEVRKAARERGQGVLLSLHDVNMAVRFAHKVILLAPPSADDSGEKGARVEACGDPAAVLTPQRMNKVYGIHMQSYRAESDAAPLWFPSS